MWVPCGALCSEQCDVVYAESCVRSKCVCIIAQISHTYNWTTDGEPFFFFMCVSFCCRHLAIINILCGRSKIKKKKKMDHQMVMWLCSETTSIRRVFHCICRQCRKEMNCCRSPVGSRTKLFILHTYLNAWTRNNMGNHHQITTTAMQGGIEKEEKKNAHKLNWNIFYEKLRPWLYDTV